MARPCGSAMREGWGAAVIDKAAPASSPLGAMETLSPAKAAAAALTRRAFVKRVGLGAGALFALAHPSRPLWAHEVSHLPRSTPEEQGVSSEAILAFLAAIGQSKMELHSFMMARHGHVVAEGWWAPYSAEYNHGLYSMSKSFTSTAVGFAVTERRLSVEDRVASFFPKDLPETISENLAALRVKHLLTMSVGQAPEATGEMQKQENWVKVFLAAPLVHEPGSVFLYNSGATYMLSAIVQAVTGQTVLEYLTPRLFQPLGVEGATWETCPRGINTGGWGLSVQTETLAKFGQLYLQKGVWEGRQIIPAAWVEEATTFKIQQPSPATPSRPAEKNDWLQGYCYQFWRCTHGNFRGDGAYGQFTIVLPEHDAVICLTSENSNLQGELDLVWENLLPAFKPEALPANVDGQARLQQTLGALAVVVPQGEGVSPTGDRVAGKTFQFEHNDLGLESVTFFFQNGVCSAIFRDGQTAYPIECGFDRWEHGATAIPKTPPRLVTGGSAKPGTAAKIVARSAWKDPNTLTMVWRYYETPHHDTVTCRFEGNEVKVAFMNSIAAMSARPQDKRPELRGQVV